jgi:succinate-semialdehyde dehydrogenase/glutarate-semialdehyde dehydrogenase
MKIIGVNPATGETLESYPEMSPAEVDQRLKLTADQSKEWRRTSFAERAQKMQAAANRLRAGRRQLAELMAREMGKPISQGVGEIDKCAAGCEFYATNAEKFLAPEAVKTDASKSFIAFEPIGVLLAIMPWNFPFWQVFRAAVPALMAGNGVVLKHASNVFGCATAIEKIFQSAGFPGGLFSSFVLGSKRAAELINHPVIQAVTLTGSTEAGKSVAAQAGAALKKCVLELGGSDPYVILEDADLELAAETCVSSRLINAGQSCIAAKRFIVVEAVRNQFQQLMVDKMQKRQPGDPMDAATTLGPLARHDLRDSVHAQVERSVDEGAKLLLGGRIPPGKGAFYPPTVLGNVTPKMTAFREETFGPVAAITTARGESEAIELANDSQFGLGAAVFTRDLKRGEEIATKQLQAGCCFVNDFVRSDPRLPFGGIKESGFGRELSVFGIREFVNIKTVYLR